MKQLKGEQPSEQSANTKVLVATIVMPKNLHSLNDKLPKPNYTYCYS